MHQVLMSADSRWVTIALIFFVFAVSGCGEDTTEGHANLDDTYLDNPELTPLFGDGAILVEKNDLVGTWVQDSEYEYSDRIVFEADGTGTFSEYDEKTYSYALDWRIDGAILGVSLDESDAECAEQETEIMTVAVLGDTLYLDALVRTEGSGDTYDGTWMIYAGETGEYVCGEAFEKGQYIDLLTITLSGDAFTATLSWDYSESWSGDDSHGEPVSSEDSGVASSRLLPRFVFAEGEESESDSGTQSYEGTVTQEGDYLVLRATDEETVYTLNPISANVMQVAEAEPDWAADYWESDIYERE